MKVKKLAVAAAIAISAIPAMAQDFEGTTYDDRIGYSNNNNDNYNNYNTNNYYNS